MKLSTKAAVFKKSELVNSGAKHVDWGGGGGAGPPLAPALFQNQLTTPFFSKRRFC